MQPTRLMFVNGTGVRGAGARDGLRDGMGIDSGILEPQTGGFGRLGHGQLLRWCLSHALGCSLQIDFGYTKSSGDPERLFRTFDDRAWACPANRLL
jgi:hypothetical protein